MKFKNTSKKNHHIETSKKDVFLGPGESKNVNEKTITRPELKRVKKLLAIVPVKQPKKPGDESGDKPGDKPGEDNKNKGDK